MRIKVTEDISLRLATENDADFLVLLDECPLAKKYIGASRTSEQEYRASLKLRVLNPDCLDWLIIQRGDGSRIGRCNLFHCTDNLTERTEIQIVLMPESWGEGIGSAAAHCLLKLSQERFPTVPITAKIHPRNTTAMRLVKKLGFVHAFTVPDDSRDDAGFQWFRKNTEASAA